jgi:hypothetical protein
LVTELFTLANFGFNQEVEVLVIQKWLNGVIFGEKPGIISKVQTLTPVVVLQSVLHHPLLQLVRKLVLAHKQVEVKLGQGQAESCKF